MTPVIPGPSSSPAATGTARSNRAAAATQPNRTATPYAAPEGLSRGRPPASAAIAAHATGSPVTGRATSQGCHESSGCGNGALSANNNPSHTTYLEAHVARMQAEIERTTRRLEMEKRRLHELGESSRKAQHEFQDKRLRYSFNKAGARAERLKAENNVLLLENRLAQALCKLNSGNDDINKLKALIDQHRKDRLAMEKVYRHIHRELAHHTEHLNHVKEKVTQMQELEQQSTRRMDELNKAKEQEREAFKQHCLAMQKELREQDRLIKESDIRAHRESSMQRTQMKGSPYSVAEEEHTFNPESLMKLIFKTALLNAVHRHNIRQYKNKISVFEKAMESIKTSTGISDAEEIVSIFSQLEERNYSVMTYVNNINVELESLESKKRQLERHMQQQAHHDSAAQRLTDETLRDVAAQISNTKLATEGKNALIQRQLQGLLQSHEMLEATVNLIRSHWKGPGPMEEPQPRESQPSATGGEKRNLLPLLWFIQKFFESHKELLRVAKNDTDLPAAIAAAHAWVAAHITAAANAHAVGNGVDAATSNAQHVVPAAVHVPGARNALPAAASVPTTTGNGSGSRAVETVGTGGSSAQGKVLANGGVYLRGRSSPVAATTSAATGGAAPGGSATSGSRVNGLSAGSPTGGHSTLGGGSVSHRRTTSSGYRSSLPTHGTTAGELRAASVDAQVHAGKQPRQNTTGQQLSNRIHSTRQRSSLSAAASRLTAGAAASAAVSSSDDATTGDCDAGEGRCGTAESCTEAAVEPVGGTERVSPDKVASPTSAGGARASDGAGTAKEAAESRSAASDDDEEEEGEEDSSDEKSPVRGDEVPLSSEELRSRTIHIFNRLRKKKAAAEGNTQPPALYLPEKRCLLASPGLRSGAAPLSSLFASAANSPLPGSPPPLAAPPACVLAHQVHLTKTASASKQGAAEDDHAETDELGAEEAVARQRKAAAADHVASFTEAIPTGEAGIAVVSGHHERQPEKEKADSAERTETAGGAGDTSRPSARRSSTLSSVKRGDSNEGLKQNNTAPHFIPQSGRMLFARQKERQYVRMEPARRSAAGSAANAPVQPKRSSGYIQPQQLQDPPPQHQQTPQASATKSSKVFGGETHFWRKSKALRQPTERAAIRQGDQSLCELPVKSSQPPPAREKLRRVSSGGVATASTVSRRKSLTTQGSKETKQQQQQIMNSAQTQQVNEEKQQKPQQEIQPGKQQATEQTEEPRAGEERLQDPNNKALQEQPQHEKQDEQRDAQHPPKSQQPQEAVQQIGLSQQQQGIEWSGDKQGEKTTCNCSSEEAHISPTCPEAIQQDMGQWGDTHHVSQEVTVQGPLRRQNSGTLKTTIREEEALQDLQDRDSSQQHEGQKIRAAHEQNLQSQKSQEEEHVQATAEVIVVRDQLGEPPSSPRELKRPTQALQVTAEGGEVEQQKQEELNQQDEYNRQNQPSQHSTDPQSCPVEHRPLSPVDSREEAPDSLSVMLRQVPADSESQHCEENDGTQKQQETEESSERAPEVSAQFAELPEVSQGEVETTETAQTRQEEARQEQTAAAEQTSPAAATASDTADNAGQQATDASDSANEDREKAVRPPISIDSGLGSSGSSCNCNSDYPSIPFDLGKGRSATVLAALWARCEMAAAEEEAGARQQAVQQARTEKLADAAAHGEDVLKGPVPQNCAQTNTDQEGIESFTKAHVEQSLHHSDASEEDRHRLVHVMERALQQAEGCEEAQQLEAKELEENEEYKHGRNSTVEAPESAGASSSDDTSSCAFLPVGDVCEQGNSVSHVPGPLPFEGIATAAAAAKTSEKVFSNDTPVFPPPDHKGEAVDPGAEVGGHPIEASHAVGENAAHVGGGAAQELLPHTVDNNKEEMLELAEHDSSLPPQEQEDEGNRPPSARELLSRGPPQSTSQGTSSAHGSSCKTVSGSSGLANERTGDARASGSSRMEEVVNKACPVPSQKPESVTSDSAAEPPASVNTVAAHVEADGSAEVTLSAPAMRQQVAAQKRSSSPLPPSVAAAAFEAIRTASIASSCRGEGFGTRTSWVLTPVQRPGSDTGFSAATASTVPRVNSARSRATSAAAIPATERSCSGPAGGIPLSFGSPAVAESVAPLTSCAAVPQGDVSAGEALHAVLESPPAATRPTVTPTTAARNGPAVPCVALSTTVPLQQGPDEDQQLPTSPPLPNQNGAVEMPADASVPISNSEPGKTQLQQHEELRDSPLNAAEMSSAPSTGAGQPVQEVIGNDSFPLSHSSSLASRASEPMQKRHLLLSQLQVIQAGDCGTEITPADSRGERISVGSSLSPAAEKERERTGRHRRMKQAARGKLLTVARSADVAPSGETAASHAAHDSCEAANNRALTEGGDPKIATVGSAESSKTSGNDSGQDLADVANQGQVGLAGTVPTSRLQSALIGGGSIPSPLPRETVVAAAAALAAAHGGSLSRRPTSGCARGSLTPVVAAALRGESVSLPSGGARTGAVSPAALALLRSRSGASDAVAAAAAESRGLARTSSCRRPSSPATVTSAIAAGAVVTVSSLPHVETMANSRPFSASLIAGRRSSSISESRPKSFEDTRQQQQPEGQQPQARDASEEQQQKIHKQLVTSTSPQDEQLSIGEHQGATRLWQQQEGDRQSEEEQIPVNTNASCPRATFVSHNVASPTPASGTFSSMPQNTEAPHSPSEADGRDNPPTEEQRRATAGTAPEECEHEVPSPPLTTSPPLSVETASEHSTNQRYAAAGEQSFSKEDRCTEGHGPEISSIPIIEADKGPDPKVPVSLEPASLVAASVPAAAETSDVVLRQASAQSLPLETKAEKDVSTPSGVVLQEQLTHSQVDKEEQQLDHLAGPHGAQNLQDTTEEDGKRKDTETPACTIEEDGKREDTETLAYTEVPRDASSEPPRELQKDTSNALLLGVESISVSPQKHDEQKSERGMDDEAFPREQSEAAYAGQATRIADASGIIPIEATVIDSDPADAAVDSAGMSSGINLGSATDGGSPMVHDDPAQLPSLSEKVGDLPATGDPPCPSTEVLAQPGSTEASAYANVAPRPHTAIGCSTAGDPSFASSIVRSHSGDKASRASAGNKHVSLNLQEEQEQRQQRPEHPYEEEPQQQPYPHWQQRRSRQSQQTRRSHMSLLSPNRRSTRLSNLELFQFSPPDLQLPEKDSPPGTPPSAAGSRPATAQSPTTEDAIEEEAFSAVVEGNRFVARVSRVERLAPQQCNKIDEE